MELFINGIIDIYDYIKDGKVYTAEEKFWDILHDNNMTFGGRLSEKNMIDDACKYDRNKTKEIIKEAVREVLIENSRNYYDDLFDREKREMSNSIDLTF